MMAVGRVLTTFGVDPRKAIRSFRGLVPYARDYREFVRQGRTATSELPLGDPYPCLGDRFDPGGTARGHYFHQDLLVARKVFERSPDRHVDVGSRIDGFVAHVAAFRSIEVIDIRPIEDTVRNISFLQADMMSDLPNRLMNYCDSVSCLHVLEHFGLGRYGDPVRPEGHLVGLKNLTLMLQRGGTLYLSVPIGRQEVRFNAHRVFSVAHMLDLVRNEFRLESFSFVDDSGSLHENVPISPVDAQASFGCAYGCGIFELTKA